MMMSSPPRSPEEWFRHLFASKAALDGGVVRRKVRDMERSVGRPAFVAEIERRGFSAVENAGQVIVFCNAEKVRPVCGRPKLSIESLTSNPREDLPADFR